MKYYHCEMEIEEVDVCPICKKEQTMTDLFGDRVYITDYLAPIEMSSNNENNENNEKSD